MQELVTTNDATRSTDKPSSILRAAKLFALGSSALAVLSTLTGAYYHYGQLSEFNLPESYFPVQLSDTLTLIHKALLSILGNYLIPMLDAPTLRWQALALGLAGGIGAYIGLQLRHKPSQDLRAWLVSQLERPIVVSVLAGLMTALSIYVIPWLIALFGGLALLTPLAGYYAGKHDAHEILAKWKACATHETGLRQRCTTIRLLEEQSGGAKTAITYTGEIVVGNDKWIGIVTDTEILAVPAALQGLRVVRNRP